MSYEIEFMAAAARQMKKLPQPTRQKVLDALENLGNDPRPHSSKKLVGEPTAWRIRVGDYRVIYEILDAQLIITVVRAAHRREAYR